MVNNPFVHGVFLVACFIRTQAEQGPSSLELVACRLRSPSVGARYSFGSPDCLGSFVVVVSDFDLVLDRCDLWNWKVKCNILMAHAAVLPCAGLLLKLEIQVMCITLVHRECTSLGNACI